MGGSDMSPPAAGCCHVTGFKVENWKQNLRAIYQCFVWSGSAETRKRKVPGAAPSTPLHSLPLLSSGPRFPARGRGGGRRLWVPPRRGTGTALGPRAATCPARRLPPSRGRSAAPPPPPPGGAEPFSRNTAEAAGGGGGGENPGAMGTARPAAGLCAAGRGGGRRHNGWERRGGAEGGISGVYLYTYIYTYMYFFFFEDRWSSGCKMGFLVGVGGGRGGTEGAGHGGGIRSELGGVSVRGTHCAAPRRNPPR